MRMMEVLKNNKIVDILSKLSLVNKIGLGLGTFFVGRNLIGSLYSGVNNVKFNAMHSGKDDNMSYYTNMAMTDFGSSWKGISDNILKLMNKKNAGLSTIIKEFTTPFNCKGTNLGKTIIKMNRAKPNPKVMKSIKIITHNPVLEMHKHRNVGHIIS